MTAHDLTAHYFDHALAWSPFPAVRERRQPRVLPPAPSRRPTGRVGRNDPCPCGSRLKFKRCCYAPEVKR
jgi:uncharacterized protein YecA (UPF0149 family)